MKPITPTEAASAKLQSVPDEIIEAFNELLSEKISLRGIVTISQNEAMDRAQSKFQAAGKYYKNEFIYEKKWMDVEPIFQNAGWKVSYDRPGFNESGEAFYYFSTK